MIGRYTRPEMRDIWTEQRKLEIWLDIELLAAEALCDEGLVPKKHLKQMKDNASFTIERCRELERTLNHDVIAFTKLLGPDESDTITFTAPKESGAYEYVCTFPGHFAMMRGTMKVK